VNTLELDGLDGTNPLHVLAALGAFALTDDIVPGATLAWARVGGTYAPRIRTTLDRDAWVDALVARLHAMGTVQASEDLVPLQRKVRDLGATRKKRLDALKKLRSDLKQESRSLALSGEARKAHGRDRTEPLEREIASLSRERSEAQMALAVSMGFGPAHLGEIIGVSVDIFRLHAEYALAHDAATARQLSALATDACVRDDDTLEPTPYSFSNGSSGKLLLKDFRALALACTRQDVDSSLFAGAPRGADMTALNWDPRDLRSYAHQWSDPATTKVQTDVAANALAYAGLGLLPSFPGRRGIEAVALLHAQDGTRGFVWPLWSPPLAMPLVRALLATASARAFAADLEAARARGIFALFRSQIVNPTGKRNFLGPSSPKRW
jgi:hypothetical protein